MTESKYMVITGNSELDLERKVTTLLNLTDPLPSYRWNLAGGLSVYHDGRLGSHTMFYQAMVRTG